MERMKKLLFYLGKQILLMVLLGLLAACGETGETGGKTGQSETTAETSAMITDVSSLAPETTPESPALGCLGWLDFDSFDDLHEQMKNPMLAHNGKTRLPTYYYLAKNPANPEVMCIAGGAGNNLGFYYQADEYGYERVYAWHRNSCIEYHMQPYKDENIPVSLLEHEGKTYYLVDSGLDHVYYYEQEDGVIQVNLPPEVGSFEDALPYLEVVKVTP